MRNPGRVMTATVLALESFVVFFGGLVAKDLSDLSTSVAVGSASALAIWLLVVAGMQGRRWGDALAWLSHAVVFATGYWVTSMFFIAVIFWALWFVGRRVGRRIAADRERWAQMEAEGKTPTDLPDSD